MIKNEFYGKLAEAYAHGATADELRSLLGKGRARRGILEGDLTEGELEIGQVSARLSEIETAQDIIRQMMEEFHQTVSRLGNLSFE